MRVVLSHHLSLRNVPEPLKSDLIQRLQFTNPKWLENHRMGRWNRGTPKTLKFYRRTANNGLVVPRGFMRQLMLAAKKSDIDLQIDDRRRKLTDRDFRFQGVLKPFQETAVAVMARKAFGTLNAPTGSGKTVIALNLIARRRQPTIIVVHTRELAAQWMERIDQFLGIPKEEIGFIGGGKNTPGGPITVAMVQSLYKCATQIAPQFGHIVVDECHRAPSRTFTEAVTAFDTFYMLGLSATPWRRDRLSELIYWYLGDVHHEIDKSSLVAEGHLLDVEVVTRQTAFKPYYDPVNEYSKMLSELTSDDQRNRQIVRDVVDETRRLNQGEVCLVLSDRKHHCENLQGLLKHKHHISAELLTGDLGEDQRRRIIEKVRKGECRVLVATGQLVGEGFDCPNLSVLFLATPIKFSGRVLQYLGRILRPSGKAEHARVYDYVDQHVAPLVAAARARARVYEQF